MRLTKENLQKARFMTKGKWYLGEQVDAFIDKVIEAVEKESAEKAELTDKLKKLEQEQKALKENDKEVLAQKDSSIAYQIMVCDELIKERNLLIEEIKVLQSQREELQKSLQTKALTEEKTEKTEKTNDISAEMPEDKEPELPAKKQENSKAESEK